MPNRWLPWLLLAIVAIGGWMAWPRQQALPAAGSADGAGALPALEAPAPRPSDRAPVAHAAPGSGTGLPAFLPAEARDTIALIQREGPFPHRQDGGLFGNREGRLPRKPRGWYREYTVDTPGLRHRGARRIVTGGDPPREWFYSDDHYDSFRRFEVTGGPP
jgi:guanyl-specific ribonuclease Sa